MNFELLETEHLFLRKLTPEVYFYVHTNYSEPELMDFFGLSTTEELAKERTKFSQGISTYNRSFVNFQIIDKSTNELLGGCGFHTWYPEHRRAEIGYALNSEHLKGKGVMTEALKAVVTFGFTQMNLHRIEAFIGPKNEASIRLVQKLHFTREGQLRQHYCKNTIMEDSVVFSLLREEFRTENES